MFAPQVAWPLIPIHVTLQPNGHLVSYGSPLGTAQQGGLAYDDWNPALGTVAGAHVDTAGMSTYNSFCNALQTLPDGRVLMVGGNSSMSTMYYDPIGKAESMGPELNRQRWYASVMRLTDDRILVLGGGNYYNTGAYLTPADNSGVATTGRTPRSRCTPTNGSTCATRATRYVPRHLTAATCSAPTPPSGSAPGSAPSGRSPRWAPQSRCRMCVWI